MRWPGHNQYFGNDIKWKMVKLSQSQRLLDSVKKYNNVVFSKEPAKHQDVESLKEKVTTTD